MLQTAIAPDQSAAQPRAQGLLRLSSRQRDGQSVLDGFRVAGCLKALFPRDAGGLQAITLNTAGGITGGDRLSIEATAGAGSALTLTTQSCERAYRARDGFGQVDTRLAVGAGARLNWLPQELILFDGAALSRRLTVDLAPDARLLLVEPVIFGRAAMGEVLRRGSFYDRIAIDRSGAPIYRDALRLSGDIAATLARPAVTSGGGAMASLVYIAPDAEAHLDPLRAMLPVTGGVSLLAWDVLALRVVAGDGFALRQTLLPVLDRLSDDGLPRCWRL